MNFRKLCRFALVFFLIIFLQGNTTAATIHGKIYEWKTFETLNNSVVEINSTPEQSLIATDSEYSFNLTRGNYTINATYLEGNKIIYTAQEEVVISDDGEYIHDLLLFPPSNEELLNQDNFEVPNLDYEETVPVSQTNSRYTLLVPAFLVLIILLLAGYLLKNRYENSTIILSPEGEKEPCLLEPEEPIKAEISPEETEIDSAENAIENPEPDSEQFAEQPEGISDTDEFIPQKSRSTEETNDLPDPSFHQEEPNKPNTEASRHSKINLPEDLRELLDMIRASGNRITQRELRKKSPYSESKVSLMLSDLEERGLIEKFKRGRGNIIRIPDIHIHRQNKRESKKE